MGWIISFAGISASRSLRIPHEYPRRRTRASRWSQIEDNLGALQNITFSPEELAAIDQACSL
jgi:hypothetical protein